jgi:hypothetical protein
LWINDLRKVRQYAGGIERKPDSRTYELRAGQLMDEFRQTEYIGRNDLRESQTVRRMFERKPESTQDKVERKPARRMDELRENQSISWMN